MITVGADNLTSLLNCKDGMIKLPLVKFVPDIFGVNSLYTVTAKIQRRCLKGVHNWVSLS